MKKIYSLIILTLFACITLSAQEFKWRSGLDFFFDNTEFARSTLTKDQTMAGVALTQELGWQFDKNQRIMAGADVLKNLGGLQFTDQLQFLVYYQLEEKNTLLKAGVFSRADLFDDYSNLFFQDSVAYYKRAVEGVFLKQGDERGYYKLWLDWTGLQSAGERETFFAGASAYKELGSLYFIDFQSYLFHFATTNPNPLGLSVSDNFQGQFSGGIRYLDYGGHEVLKVSAGIMAGFERDRVDMGDYYLPLGFLLRADGRYKNFGTENILYFGDPRMHFYSRYGNQLYWGNPFLQAGSYFQNKLYWKWMERAGVKGELALRTHVSEGKLFSEQLLTLRVQLDSPGKKKETPGFFNRLFP